MLLNKPGKPSLFKKIIYVTASTFLGFLLSVIAHALLEINLIQWFIKHDYPVFFYGVCALPPLLQFALGSYGILGGFWLGLWWWRKIYVEKVWKKKRLFRRKK